MPGVDRSNHHRRTDQKCADHATDSQWIRQGEQEDNCRHPIDEAGLPFQSLAIRRTPNRVAPGCECSDQRVSQVFGCAGLQDLEDNIRHKNFKRLNGTAINSLLPQHIISEAENKDRATNWHSKT